MDDADWQVQIDNNLTGTANVIRAFAPCLVRRGGGRLIVTSSTQGRHGTKYGAAYSASKWGIIGLMKSAALELAKHRITVNAVIPGLIDTPLTRHEERYAQAIEEAGHTPVGAPADEATARRALIEDPARRTVDRAGGRRAGRDVPRLRRGVHGDGRDLRRHRRRQRPQRSVSGCAAHWGCEKEQGEGA
jgi:NAD(P)-dependent dehydrogenase (short-subunit alcohol dehydrogenase family)